MAPLRPISYPDKPSMLIAADLFTLPLSDSENRYALVVIDHCSKYLGAVPLSSKFSIAVTEALKTSLTTSARPKCY